MWNNAVFDFDVTVHIFYVHLSVSSTTVIDKKVTRTSMIHVYKINVDVSDQGF